MPQIAAHLVRVHSNLTVELCSSADGADGDSETVSVVRYHHLQVVVCQCRMVRIERKIHIERGGCRSFLPIALDGDSVEVRSTGEQPFKFNGVAMVVEVDGTVFSEEGREASWDRE